jgi:multidrug resistance protein, MATE family
VKPPLSNSRRRWCIPSILPFYIYQAVLKYLNAQGHNTPAFVVGVSSLALTALLSYPAIFGIGPLPGLGWIGAAITFASVRTLMPVALVAFVRMRGLHKKTWFGVSRKDALDWGGIKAYLKLGVPTALTLGLEEFTFVVVGVFAGWIGDDALAAMVVKPRRIFLTPPPPLRTSGPLLFHSRG